MKYFLPGNLNYENGYNGDYNLQPINGTYHSGQINEIPYIKFELDRDEYGLWTNVVRDGVVVSDVPYGDKEDWFRIWEVDKDSKEDSITVTARHIFYDLVSTVAKDFNNDDICIVATGLCNGQQALTKLLNNTKFIAHSNIIKTDSVRWERKYITEALLSDDDNSFVNRWGGELYVHKYDVYMNTSIGSDKGVRITYGKNIDQISENVDMSNLVTRIIPVGYDGLRLTGNTPWVDSPNISNYATIHDSVVKFDKVKVGTDEGDFATEELARKELIRLSNLMFSNDRVDTPTVNIKIDMIELSTTDEYKNYSCLEEVWQGDTVYCNHDKLNIDTKARCISYTWDIVNHEKIDNEIGDVTESYFDKQNNLASTLQQIVKDGRIDASYIKGIINSFNTVLKAQYSVAQKQHVRAILFEDLDPDSSTFGASCYGTRGWQISKERTADGKDWVWSTAATGAGIVADMILVGTLTAITIQNADGSFKIDLSKSGGCNFYNDDNLAMNISNNQIKFYNWGSSKSYIGSIGSTTKNGYYDGTPYVELWHDPSLSAISIGYKNKDTGMIAPYIRFDKDKKDNKNSPIEIDEETSMGSDFDMNGWKLYLNKNNYSDLYLGTSTLGWLWCNGGFVASGDIECKGSKKCVQQTENYGNVPFYATEDMDSYLTWTLKNGVYLYTKPSKSGDCYNCIVKIPDIVQEGINTKMQYDVIYYKYGRGDIWTHKITEKFFIVHSDYPLKFRCSIRGMRKNFENNNLENTLRNSQKQLKDKAHKLYLLDLWKRCGKEWENNYGICYEG